MYKTLSLSISSIVLLAAMGSVQAAEHHAAQALEHAAVGATHGEMKHSDVLTIHVAEALKHAQESEKEHAAAHNHMTEAIKHLKEAMSHGNQGHAEQATEHTNEAISHIKQTIGQ